jgi:hypothetical protein
MITMEVNGVKDVDFFGNCHINEVFLDKNNWNLLIK